MDVSMTHINLCAKKLHNYMNGRVGHFLNGSKLIFKHKPFILHPLVQRPKHSSTYSCTFAYNYKILVHIVQI